MTAPEPTWTVRGEGAHRRVCLMGRWTLFMHSRAGDRLQREMQRLDSPSRLAWDFTHVEALDSAAALFFWRLWGQSRPTALECPDKYRHWFERLESLPEFTPQPRLTIYRSLELLGGKLVAVMQAIRGLFALLGSVGVDFMRCVRHPRVIPWREISASVYHTGVSSMAILGITGLVIGVVMTLQLGVNLKQFGANEQIIGMLGLAVLRELGAVIAALIQSGRAGSSITAGIAGMYLTEELNALRTFGGIPTLRLVFPRVVGMALVMPLLVVWTDFTELLGGMIASQFYLGIPHALFVARLPDSVALFNFWMGLAKGSLFGITISVVGCYFGLQSDANTDSLSRQTTKSVVVSLSLVLIFDAASGALLALLGVF